MSRRRRQLRAEPLEARRTPATLGADGKTLTYQDADGDSVTVAFTRPVLTAANANTVFAFDTGSVNGDNSARQQLQQINLTALPGASFTVSATAANGGNGTADVGWLNATGVDVGSITISGDLGRITAGDSNPRTPAVRALAVGSIGVRGPATQAAGGSLVSDVTGNLTRVTVTGDVDAALVSVTGNLGNVTIGGSLTADPNAADTGALEATGSIGVVKITGAVTGGAGDRSGVRAGGTIRSVTVGSLVGGGGVESAAIVSTGGSVGPVVVNGPMTGGSGLRSASVRALGTITQPNPNRPRVLAGGKITSVKVVGAVTGDGPQSAALQATGSIGKADLGSLTGGTGDGSAAVTAQWGGVGPVTVRGAITGGSGLRSASVHANGSDPGPAVPPDADPTTLDYGSTVPGGGKVRGVTVTGAVTGTAAGTAVIEGMTMTGPVQVGSLVGGSDFSAVIEAEDGNIPSVQVAGDVIGGSGAQTGWIAARGANPSTNVPHSLGPVKIAGDLRGGAGDSSGAVYSQGGVGAVTIGGSVVGAGGSESGSVTAAAGSIGAVHITGDLTAGTGAGSGQFRAAELALNPYSPTGGKIISLAVGGSVTGGGTADSSVAVLADRGVGAVTVGQDWTATSLVVGLIQPGPDGWFGTDDDTDLTGGPLGPVTIGGQVQGTAAADDAFAFLASQVLGLKVGGTAVPLNPGPQNDITIPLDPVNNDFLLTEVSPTG